MSEPQALLYLWLLLRSSLISTGGTANIPLIYAEFVPRGWAADRDFAEALAIGQITPGPTGLWVISFGYLTYGLRGVLLALIAILLPPLLVLPIAAIYRWIEHHPAVQGFVRGLSLAGAGVFLVVLARLLYGAGLDVPSLLIAGLSAALGLYKRIPVILILILAALLGILVG
jgi:chromate transporter